MSLLYVCDNYFYRYKGQVYSNGFSYEFFKNFLDIFSHVTVVGRVCDVDSLPELPVASGEGVDFVFLENISTFRSFFGLRKKHKMQLNKLMNGYDRVIARLPTELGLLALDVARKQGKICMADVVGCAWDAMWNYGGIKAKFYAPLFYGRMKSIVKRVDCVMYVTNNFLQTRYPCGKNAKSIGISDVQLEVVDDDVLLRRFRKTQEVPKKIVFGTIGSLKVDYKGIDAAIAALAGMARKGIEFEYRILGEGDSGKYRKLVQVNGIETKISFDGTLPGGEAVYHWLDDVDIYLQPSKQEGLPRSLIEAMSRACPAVGSDAGGIPELLDAAAIFPSGDANMLAEAIGRFIADSAWMKDQAERNFNKARTYQVSRLSQKRKQFLAAFKNH